MSPEDFAKVASSAGCDATITNVDGEVAVVALKHGRRSFFAIMDLRIPKQTLYSLVTLQTTLTPRGRVTDEAINDVNSTTHLVKIWREDRHTVRLQMALMLVGGVTGAWLVKSLEHWIGSLRECERQLRRAIPTRPLRKLQRAELIQ